MGTSEQTSGRQMDDATLQWIPADWPESLQAAVGHVGAALVALLAVLVGYLVASYVARAASRPICQRVDQTLGKFVGKVIYYGIMLAVIGLVLGSVGIEVGGLATILAAAGFAVGLAFQGTLSHFAAGVLLLVFRPFKVGDFVQVAGVMGTVDEIDLFTTTLDTPDNRRIIIPNSMISGSTIENISRHQHRRVEVNVGVAYEACIDRTREALTRACVVLQEQIVSGEGRGHSVLLSELGDHAVQWTVRAWVNASDFLAMREALTVEIKQQLDAAEIAIPFPQMDVHLHRLDGGDPTGLSSRTRPRLRHEAREIRRESV